MALPAGVDIEHRQRDAIALTTLRGLLAVMQAEEPTS